MAKRTRPHDEIRLPVPADARGKKRRAKLRAAIAAIEARFGGAFVRLAK